MTQLNDIGNAEYLANKYNSNSDSATTLYHIINDDIEYDLRVCGLDNDAFFEWINDAGDPVGDMFYIVDQNTVNDFLSTVLSY